MSALGLGLGLGLGSQSQRRNNDMILVYEIPSAGTPIQLAIQANSMWFSAGQSVVISWGDGSANETVSDTGGSTYIRHTYAAAGTYKVKISGSMTMYGRSSGVNLAGQTLLTRIDSFGKLGLTSLSRAFRSCTGLTSVPKTLPSKVTNMAVMFHSCSGAAFNPDVSNWDVSNVREMGYMFSLCSGNAFNPDVSNWNVSKVESMYEMFHSCSGDAFRGGRGVDGSGIANWQLKTGNNAVNMNSFMSLSKTQDPPFLDDILNAWAALHAQGKLPTNITVHFGTNKYTAAGAAAYTTLTTITDSGGAGWTIPCGGLQA